MLGGNRLQYKELRMPACSEVAQAIVNWMKLRNVPLRMGMRK
jgi:hypothetical protein